MMDLSIFRTALRRAPQPVADPAAGLSLNAFFDAHYLPYARSTKKSHRADALNWGKHFRDTLGRLPLDALDTRSTDDWRRAQLRKGLKPSTVNKHIFLYNRVITLARHWGMLEPRKTFGQKMPRVPVGDAPQRLLEPPEIARLVTACDATRHPWLPWIVRLLLLTGARKGEVLNARWRDIDAARGVLTVPVSKTGRARRIVLGRAALDLLDEIAARAGALGLGALPRDPLFANPDTGLPYTCIHRAFDRARRRAGLPGVRVHDLRHTFASLLVNAGVSLYEVQKLLGHGSVQMTQRYAHLRDTGLRDRVALVAEALARPDPSARGLQPYQKSGQDHRPAAGPDRQPKRRPGQPPDHQRRDEQPDHGRFGP